jgi:hypothetical protein
VEGTDLLPPCTPKVLTYPRLAQVRTFVKPFLRCKFFFASHARNAKLETAEEFRLWKGQRYIFISGYEACPAPTFSISRLMPQRIVVGLAIHGAVNGPPGLLAPGESQPSCRIQAFQLSPEHRVYGFESCKMNLDPMLNVKFGLSNNNWEEAVNPTGKTRMAFMEDMNECVFEHGTSDSQDKTQRWVPFGMGSPRVVRIRVESWEVWGFDEGVEEQT